MISICLSIGWIYHHFREMNTRNGIGNRKPVSNLTFKGDEKPDCKIFIKNIRTDKETGKKKCIVVLESKRKIFKYWNVNLDEIDHWITKSIGEGRK